MGRGLRAIGRAVSMGAVAFSLLLAFNLVAQSAPAGPGTGPAAVVAIPLAQP